MAYDASKRREVLQGFRNELDFLIYMCDDQQDLFALAAMMIVASKGIIKSQIGTEKTREIFEKVLEDIDNDG
jgi:hypothetical protein